MKEKSDLIVVDLQSKDSLQQALETFLSKLRNSALKIGFDVENLDFEEKYTPLFYAEENGEPRYFDYGDVVNPEMVEAVLANGEGAFSFKKSRKEVWVNDPRFAEAVVFVAALEHPELKQLVVEIAEAIVAFSIDKNDTDSLWIDDCHVFGLDIIYTLALFYPEYTYLIGQYITPYWDSEHADYVFNYLKALKKKQGYGQHILKAIANSYNDEQIERVAKNDYNGDCELHDHFQENPDDFVYFCDEVVEHVRLFPIEKEDDEGRHIVELIMSSILPSMTEEEMEKEVFVHNTYAGTISQLRSKVNSVLEGVSPSAYFFQKNEKSAIDVWDDLVDHEEEQGGEYAVNKDFLINGFDNGEEIWAYVQHGENPEVLDTIVPAELLSLAEDRGLKILPRLKYMGSELEPILRYYFDEYSDDDDDEYVVNAIGGKSYKPSPNKEIALRVVDVFFHLGGKELLDDDTIEAIVDTYELCNMEDLQERYKVDNKEVLAKKVASLISSFFIEHMPLNSLDRIYLLYKQDPTVWKEVLDNAKEYHREYMDESMLAVLPKVTDRSVVYGSQLLSVAYVCNKEGGLRPDENLQVLVDFFANHFWDTLMYEMLEYSRYRGASEVSDVEVLEAKVKAVKEYCIGKQATPPPREIIMKLMQGGPAALTEEELQIFEAAKKQAAPMPLEEVEAILQDLFATEENHKGTPYVHLFRRSENIGMLLAAAAYGARGLPMSFEPSLKKVFNLLVSVDPVKALDLVYKNFHNDQKLIDPMNLNDFIELMDKLGVPLSQVKAWEIVFLQKKIDHYTDPEQAAIDRLHTLEEAYAYYDKIDEDQPGLWKRQEEKEKAALKGAIQYLDMNRRLRFISAANKLNSRKEFEDFIHQENEERLQEALDDFCKRIINFEKPGWARNEEENLLAQKEVEEAAEWIKDYLFNTGDFTEIEEKLMPKLVAYIPSSLDAQIWAYEDKVKHRALYMLVRFGHMNRVYDYWSHWDDLSRRMDKDITAEFYNLLIEIGAGESYAMHFILKNYQAIHQSCDFEDNSFAQHYHNIYSKVHLFELMESLPANLVIFGIRQIQDDLSMTPQLLEFFGHPKRKVRDEVLPVLIYRLEERVEQFNAAFLEYADKAKGKSKNTYQAFLQAVREKESLTKHTTVFDQWEARL
ncbi:hypothetical protein V6R21_21395 [Limibacter armeniacum]|uniref:hypothetical protein n=1 Tax=Limibacter armeniacum TaxID=466084 RepID=UPI002FE67DB4